MNKYVLPLCIVLLLIAGGISLDSTPLGYYTLVRIVVTVGAVWLVVKEPVKGVNLWRVIFGFIAILFNPIIPVRLERRFITNWGGGYGDYRESYYNGEVMSLVCFLAAGMFLIKCVFLLVKWYKLKPKKRG